MSLLLCPWAPLARRWLCFADDRRAVKWNDWSVYPREPTFKSVR